MTTRKQKDVALSRRNFIATAGAVAAGGVLATGAMPNFAAAKPVDPGPLPWPWVKLDPQEAGERAFLTYHEKGG
jgi:hypothetical protein